MLKDRASLNVGVLLDAIAAVESGNRWSAIGKLGERGRCQFMAGTWARYTNACFDVWASRDCDVSRKVERAHLARVCDTLARRGLEYDPSLIAAAWRFGESRAVQFRQADSAQRVANLYWARMGL